MIGRHRAAFLALAALSLGVPPVPAPTLPPIPPTPEPEPDHAAHLSRAERRRQMKAAKRLAAQVANTTKGATDSAAPPVSLNSHSR